jgi:hypothetical protein
MTRSWHAPSEAPLGTVNPTRRYANPGEAYRDIEAKVRIMNRAYEVRDLLESFPDDEGVLAMLGPYEKVIRHLAEVYNRHPDYQRDWWPQDV